MRRFLYRAHRGVSLVEILVAMVILLIGIYSLVRLFPAGFTTIIYGRNVTQAQALTRGLAEAMAVRAGTLPDGVVAFNPETQTVFPMLPVDAELARYPLDPNVPPDRRFSDVNKVRRVLGERTRIPPPTNSSPYVAGPVSVYVLNFSPIYSVEPTRSGLGGIYVYSGNALRRVVFDGPPDTADLAALDELSYGVDYGNGTLYFRPVDYARQFKVEFSFTAGAGPGAFVREFTRPDTLVTLPANQQQYRLPLPAGARLEPDEEFVFRAFDRLAFAQGFSGDNPYQFKVLNATVGIIGFNPLAATLRSPDSPRGLTARIDYDVDDWHIIREDRVVPSAAPNQIKLTLDGIQRLGSVDEYQETYAGLIKDYPGERPAPQTQGVDLLVVDLDTGLTMDNRTLTREEDTAEAAGNNLNGEINYGGGAINFREFVQWTLPNNQLSGPDRIAGKRVRIFYRTDQNWALQLTKAFDNYVRERDLTDIGYREYGQDPPGSGILYFPIADHDQAVLVDYTWVHRLENGQDVLRTETGEYHQISNPEDVNSPQRTLGSTAPYWWAWLDNAKRSDCVPGSVLVQRVRGVSVRARAIWREGNRWRRLDLDSYAGRERGT